MSERDLTVLHLRKLRVATSFHDVSTIELSCGRKKERSRKLYSERFFYTQHKLNSFCYNLWHFNLRLILPFTHIFVVI
jgi:hypothetical protein